MAHPPRPEAAIPQGVPVPGSMPPMPSHVNRHNLLESLKQYVSDGERVVHQYKSHVHVWKEQQQEACIDDVARLRLQIEAIEKLITERAQSCSRWVQQVQAEAQNWVSHQERQLLDARVTLTDLERAEPVMMSATRTVSPTRMDHRDHHSDPSTPRGNAGGGGGAGAGAGGYVPSSSSSAVAHHQSQQSEDPPRELVCPITLELMQDPVIATDGHTYERAAIQQVIERVEAGQTPTSPCTNLPLESRTLIPNVGIRSMCRQWQQDHDRNGSNTNTSSSSSTTATASAPATATAVPPNPNLTPLPYWTSPTLAATLGMTISTNTETRRPPTTTSMAANTSTTTTTTTTTTAPAVTMPSMRMNQSPPRMRAPTPTPMMSSFSSHPQQGSASNANTTTTLNPQPQHSMSSRFGHPPTPDAPHMRTGMTVVGSSAPSVPSSSAAFSPPSSSARAELILPALSVSSLPSMVAASAMRRSSSLVEVRDVDEDDGGDDRHYVTASAAPTGSFSLTLAPPSPEGLATRATWIPPPAPGAGI